ncbi:MAG: hypothetical protein K6L73_02800 [Cellvibrionaceae bacterium]
MTKTLLHISDTQLRLFREGQPIATEEAIARIQNNSVIFGSEAKEQSRLHPRETNDQYFWKMDASPLPQVNDTYKHHADLVYGQLLSMFEKMENGSNQWLLITPSAYTQEQLALLLGVVKALPFQTAGLIDSATAWAEKLTEGEWKLVELQANHCLVSDITVTETTIEKQYTLTLPLGRNQLITQAANLIAKQFVEQTRFDPLFSAETEQQLYNAIPTWLQSNEETLSLDNNGHSISARISREQLNEAFKQFWLPLHKLEGNMAISAADSSLPALTSGFKHWHSLDEDRVFKSCLNNWNTLYNPDDAQPLITSLSRSQETV